MFFQSEWVIFWSFGATKNQLISRFLGPFSWTGSCIWSAWYLRIYFQGSPPGDRLLIKSLARRAFNWALGFMILRPPCDEGSVSVSHLTLVCVLASSSPPPGWSFKPSPYPYLVAHSGIGVPASHHVPHGWEEDLVCNKDSSCEEEIAVTPSSWWELVKLLVVCNQVFFPTLFFIFKMNCFEKFTCF